MSIAALNWAFDYEAKNASEKAVLLALANYAGGDGRCHPGQESIAKKASCSDRTVRTILADLEDRGVIFRERRNRKDGSRTSDVIVIVAISGLPENSSGSETGNRKIVSSLPENSSGLTSFEPPVEPSAAARANEKSDFDALSEKLLGAVGEGNIQPHGALVLGPIIGLIEAGCDLETDILPTIRARAVRLKRPAGSWAYFVEPIREAYEQRIAAGRGLTKPRDPSATPASIRRERDSKLSREELRQAWIKRLEFCRRRREWVIALMGPPPGHEDCLVPDDLLTDHDRNFDWYIEPNRSAA